MTPVAPSAAAPKLISPAVARFKMLGRAASDALTDNPFCANARMPSAASLGMAIDPRTASANLFRGTTAPSDKADTNAS